MKVQSFIQPLYWVKFTYVWQSNAGRVNKGWLYLLSTLWVKFRPGFNEFNPLYLNCRFPLRCKHVIHKYRVLPSFIYSLGWVPVLTTNTEKCNTSWDCDSWEPGQWLQGNWEMNSLLTDPLPEWGREEFHPEQTWSRPREGGSMPTPPHLLSRSPLSPSLLSK